MKSKKRLKEEVLDSLREVSSSSDDIFAKIRRARLYNDADVRTALERSSLAGKSALLNDSAAIMALESDLIEQARQISADFLSPSDELSHLLCALEELNRETRGIRNSSVPSIDIEKVNLDGHLYESLFDQLSADDYFLTYIGTVIRWLTRGRSTGDVISRPTAKGIKRASRHIPSSSTWQMFHEAKLIWEYGSARLRHDHGTTVFDSSNNDLVDAFRISLSRLRAFRAIRCHDPLNASLVKSGSTSIGLDRFRTYDELRSAYLISLQFHSPKLAEIVHGASLLEWLRAYQLLKEWADEAIKITGTAANPSELLVRTNRASVVEKLIGNGISSSAAESIASKLVFSNVSKDLLDAPLVELGGDLVFCPSITMLIEPAYSLESALRSIDEKRNDEINFTGHQFEATIRGELKLAGIYAKKIEVSSFDCDAAFVLDDVLYLCECKSKFIAADFHAYVQLEENLRTKAVEQHERTMNFFSKNLNHVRNRLKLPHHWHPTRIQGIIVTSAKLGRPITRRNIIIADENTFHAYFSRRPMRLVSFAPEREFFEIQDDRLDRPISAEAFEEFLKDPPSIKQHRTYLQPREVSLEFASGPVKIADVECFGEIALW